MGKKNKKLNLDKDALYDYYINKELSPREIGEIFNCTTKSVRNYLIKYDIPLRSMSESIVISSSKRSDDTLRKRAQKFRKTWYLRPIEEREEINKSRKTKPENLKLAIEKSKITKMANKSGKQSKSEDSFYKMLLIIFEKDDIIRQYYDKDRYPFNCDFYIKSKDLFIEYQGHPSHGYCPFNRNNKDHINYLSKQTLDMTTWTHRDVLKLDYAKKSNINLLLVYPRHDNYLLKNNKLLSFQISDLEKI